MAFALRSSERRNGFPPNALDAVGMINRSAEWTYVILTISAFVLTPFLRRIVEWRGAHDSLNAASIVPLLMLIPIAILAFRRRRNLRRSPFSFVAFAWLSGFVYAAFVAAASGAIAQACFGLVEFCLPAAIGLWLMTRGETMAVAHVRIARLLLILGSAAGLYGIFQYVVAPPWDTAWLQNIQIPGNFGTPERFGIRVFSFMTDPIEFSLFTGCAILCNLPYLRSQNMLHMGAVVVMAAAIILSLYRTAWLAIAIGVLIYIVLSPKPLQAFLRLTVIVTLLGFVGFGLLLSSPDPTLSDKVTKRFTTLADIQNDYSFQQRAAQRDETLSRSLDHLGGAGLGVTGRGGKLGDSFEKAFVDAPSDSIDNGFVARFFEMGVIGFFGFALACGAAIIFLFRIYRRFLARGSKSQVVIVASCLATATVIVLANLSDDSQHGLLGTLFFIVLALPMMTQDIGGESSVPVRRLSRGGRIVS